MDRQVHCAGGRLDMPPREQGFDAPVVVGLLPARAGDDPAAQRGEFEGLWEVPERVPACVQLLFDFRPAYTRLEGCQVRGLIQCQQVVKAGKIHGQDRCLAGDGINVADYACSAAKGDQLYAGLSGVIQQAAHLLVGSRVGHAVREGPDLPRAQRDPIRQRLPTRMPQALFRIGGNERMGRESRRRNSQDGLFQ